MITRDSLRNNDGTGSALLFELALQGQLHQIPRELLDTETILLPSQQQNTVVHYAAYTGEIWYISRSLTADSLFLENWNGQTPLTKATLFGNLNLIELKFIQGRYTRTLEIVEAAIRMAKQFPSMGTVFPKLDRSAKRFLVNAAKKSLAAANYSGQHS